MNTKINKLRFVWLLIIFGCLTSVAVQAQDVEPVIIHRVVNGAYHEPSRQKFGVGVGQPVALDKREFWVTVKPGFTAYFNALKKQFDAGRHKLDTRKLTASGIVTVKINMFSRTVTLFSEKGLTGLAHNYRIGVHLASKSAFTNSGGDNAATSVYVPAGMWVRLCENENNGKGGGKCETHQAGKATSASRALRYDNTASFVQVGSGDPPR